jgi:hypothetical protein
LEDLKIAFRQLLLFEKTEAAVVGRVIPIAWAPNRTTSIFRGNVPRLCGSFWYRAERMQEIFPHAAWVTPISSHPINTEGGRLQNRRVEIIISDETAGSTG